MLSSPPLSRSSTMTLPSGQTVRRCRAARPFWKLCSGHPSEHACSIAQHRSTRSVKIWCVLLHGRLGHTICSAGRFS